MKGKSILIMAVIAAVTLIGAGTAMAVITGSAHDLSSTNTTANYYSQGVTTTTEVCVFCHTPHNADSAAAVSAPLWNKTYTTLDTGFTAYGNTMRGTATAAAITDSTRSCLSCHDGVEAMNSMNNAPGPGDTQISATGLGPITPGATIIDVNFTDDHPIGVVYFDTNDLRAPSGASPITGIVQIGGIDNVLATSGTDTVECSSCHSVHNDSNLALFLPIENINSQLCLTCHLK